VWGWVWCAWTVAWGGVVTVDVLDIGQGDAILVQGGGQFVLIDAGDRGATTVQQLQQLGITRLDLVVGTHPHADHIGEMPDVLRTFEVGAYLDNGLPHTTATYADTMALLEAKGIPHTAAQRGTRIPLGEEAAFTVLFPDQAGPLTGTRSDLNSNSVVLRLDHGDNALLLVGDSEAPTEDRLVADGLAPVDLLKVAHHGSNHSSTDAFLAAAAPMYAVISVGIGNRYGHPGEETLARLHQRGAMVYRTDQSGDLRIVSDGVHLEILEGPLTEVSAVRLVDGGQRRAPPPPPLVKRDPTPPPAARTGTPSVPAVEPAAATPTDRTTRRQAKRDARAQRKADRQASRAGGLY
jgi:competence protein ComEC